MRQPAGPLKVSEEYVATGVKHRENRAGLLGALRGILSARRRRRESIRAHAVRRISTMPWVLGSRAI